MFWEPKLPSVNVWPNSGKRCPVENSMAEILLNIPDAEIFSDVAGVVLRVLTTTSEWHIIATARML